MKPARYANDEATDSVLNEIRVGVVTTPPAAITHMMALELLRWRDAYETRAIVDASPPAPIPMRLHCPECGKLHDDTVGELANKPHHTHACQHCGNVWRPAVVHTIGVRFLPGFKDQPKTEAPWARDVPTPNPSKESP